MNKMSTAEKVADVFFNELFKVYLVRKKKSLDEEKSEEIDVMYGGIFSFYQNLTAEQKQCLDDYLEQMVTDVASTIFGVLDGTTFIGLE